MLKYDSLVHTQAKLWKDRLTGFHALQSWNQPIAYWITLVPEIGAQLYEAVRELCSITEKTKTKKKTLHCGSSSFKLFKTMIYPANLKLYEQLDQLDK